MDDFKALVLSEEGKKVSARFDRLSDSALPDGDVTVRVAYSTVNYKDGMILGGIGRLVRDYPHVPGIDFAGIVERSDHPNFTAGEAVVLTGWRVGETHWGGYAERARVKADWLVKLPAALSLKQAMAVGTAGFTAMLAIDSLEKAGLNPQQGEVLVTGAAGGVGSVATAILATLGYTVVAATGRHSSHEYLRRLGASSFIDRSELAEPPSRPLAKERFAAAIDNVGGHTLANLLTQMQYAGSVASIGLAGGNQLNTTVLPFLLRGVSILGIDSVMCPAVRRQNVWDRLAASLPLQQLDAMTVNRDWSELVDLGKAILAGKLQGRTVVKIAGDN